MPTPRHKSHRATCLLALVLGQFTLAISADTASAAIDAATVQQSIDRGVAYLRATQSNRGGWKEYTGQNGGLSCLCTLSLLTAGVPVDDPSIQKSLAYLRSLEPNETYSVALQTLVFCQIGAAGDLVRIRRNVAWLEESQNGESEGIRSGGWGYGGGRGGGDPSNSQFALLALDAAEQRGIKVNSKVYALAAKYWADHQTGSGAWGYGATSTSTGGMTCAGIASTVICRGRLGEASSRIEKGSLVCCGGQLEGRDPVEAGLNWLGERFSVQINPGNSGSSTLYYYLYALERVGRLTGRRFIGGHDWYREGAQRLVDLQDGFQGFWSGVGFGEEDKNVTTSFAILFLAKGKRQVVIGRLRHGAEKVREDGQWNDHPDASRQLVLRLERNWGRDLTWQTVTTDNARVDDILQTPLLVVTGKEALQLSPAELELLKDFIDQGGSLLFDASAGSGCGPGIEFEQSVRQICSNWFPSAPLAPLAPTHPVYAAEAQVNPTLIASDYQLSGVEACCRTAVFFSPQSLTCRWELSDPTGRHHSTDAPQAIKDSLETSARLGQNLLAYVTGRELKNKLDTPLVIRDVDQRPLHRGAIQIARLQLNAGARDARRAIPNLVAIASERTPIHLQAVADELPLDANVLADQTIVWMHGRTDFQLNADQRQGLRTYLEHGGVLIIDSICGSPEFTTAVRRELNLVVPQSALKPMASDHPAMTAQYGGYDLGNVTIRTPSRGAGIISINRRQASPLLESATVDGAETIFFSPLDLSCALESQNSIQCPGYDTNDASRICINLILYALQQ